jgi:3-hydroxyacyl-CoA dehydrogenase
MVLSIGREGPVAVVTIDNPPVNALSHAVRAGLAEAAGTLVPEAGVRAVLLICAGRTFLAGADIREFDQPFRPPGLGEVVDRIADSPVPWVAAIHGTAFGGGLEVALGCHWRIAVPSAQVGLPEVRLGIIPGAGGTQRLPRVAPLATAVEMVTTGNPLAAPAALGAGIIDRLAEGDLREAGLALAREVMVVPVRRMDPAPADDGGADWAALAAEVARRARGQESPGRALEALRAAFRLPLAEGLRAERAIIEPLFASPQSLALRHAFFAERAVAKPPGLGEAKPRPLDRIVVAGGGLMGAGIAAAALGAGLAVTLIERDADAAAAGRARVADLVGGAERRGLIGSAEAEGRLARLTATADYGAAAGAPLAIEAVFEDRDVKAAVFASLAAAMGEAAILATNTSYLDPGSFTAGLPNPSRILGLHFFSPAHVMRLVEVVRTPATAPDVIATGFALAKAMGKTAVLCGVCEGFVGNRILAAYGRLALRLVEEGAAPQEIDAAMRLWGWPMGLFEMQDMAGLQIGYANRRRRAAAPDPGPPASRLPDLVFEAGREGQRSGRGWYRYAKGSRTPEPDPEVEAIIAAERARLGLRPRVFDPREIQAQLLAVMANEGAAILGDGIVARPLDIDVVEMLGYGYPRWRGGPMKAADLRGLAAILHIVEEIAAQPGSGVAVAPLLADLARSGRDFETLNRQT